MTSQPDQPMLGGRISPIMLEEALPKLLQARACGDCSLRSGDSWDLGAGLGVVLLATTSSTNNGCHVRWGE